MTAFLVALVPSAGVLLVFWIGIKALVEADRRERAAQSRIEAAERRTNVAGEPVHSPPGESLPPQAGSGPGRAAGTAGQ